MTTAVTEPTRPERHTTERGALSQAVPVRDVSLTDYGWVADRIFSHRVLVSPRYGATDMDVAA